MEKWVCEKGRGAKGNGLTLAVANPVMRERARTHRSQKDIITA